MALSKKNIDKDKLHVELGGDWRSYTPRIPLCSNFIGIVTCSDDCVGALVQMQLTGVYLMVRSKKTIRLDQSAVVGEINRARRVAFNVQTPIDSRKYSNSDRDHLFMSRFKEVLSGSQVHESPISGSESDTRKSEIKNQKRLKEEPYLWLRRDDLRLAKDNVRKKLADRGIKERDAARYLKWTQVEWKAKFDRDLMTNNDVFNVVKGRLQMSAVAARKSFSISKSDADSLLEWMPGQWAAMEDDGTILPKNIRDLACALKKADLSIATPSEMLSLRTNIGLSAQACDRLLGKTSNWWSGRERGIVKMPRFYLHTLEQKFLAEQSKSS